MVIVEDINSLLIEISIQHIWFYSQISNTGVSWTLNMALLEGSFYIL